MYDPTRTFNAGMGRGAGDFRSLDAKNPLRGNNSDVGNATLPPRSHSITTRYKSDLFDGDMRISETFPADNVGEFDYIIVGGGTAGCIIASRLSSYLPQKSILLLEAGPSDVGEKRALVLKDRNSMLGTDLDFGYTTVTQPMGNSHITHSRAKILGGCSSHNDMVSFRTPEYDAYTWEKLGCQGWSFDMFSRVQDQLRLSTLPGAHPRDRNQMSKDWVQAAHRALGIPFSSNLNENIASSGGLNEAVGWTPLSYNPENGWRSSASIAYIHPILRGEEERPNLSIVTRAWVSHINIQGNTVVSVDVTTHGGMKRTVKASSEVILCAGAIDTPKLMLLSGLGPREDLRSINIPLVKDIPGVGKNLQDHPATVMLYDLHDPVPSNTATHSDVLAFLRHKPYNWKGDDGKIPDTLLHIWALDLSGDAARLGYDIPTNPFCILPVVLRPQARGEIYLKSNDPTEIPAIDFNYFEDPDGYDAELLVAAIKSARKVVETEPFRKLVKREVAPGPDIVTDEDLDKYARAVGTTIFHPACTTKMGDTDDPMVVVDPKLRVRGLTNLRIADAGVFPTMITVNLMLTVCAVGERAAELIAQDAGWAGLQAQARL